MRTIEKIIQEKLDNFRVRFVEECGNSLLQKSQVHRATPNDLKMTLNITMSKGPHTYSTTTHECQMSLRFATIAQTREGPNGREKVPSRVSASERTALAACSETNPIQNPSTVLTAVWMAELLSTSLAYYHPINRHAAFALAGMCWNFMFHALNDFGLTEPFLLQHIARGVTCPSKIREAPSVNILKYLLKTHIFTVVNHMSNEISTVVEWRNRI